MIRAPGAPVAFSEAVDGDQRGDPAARARLARELGVSDSWATASQVHGASVLEVDSPGDSGEGDALWTTRPGLPLAVFTADCFGVVLTAPDAVGVAHAGWRGVTAGVVAALRERMAGAGRAPDGAWVGPGIGSCCFEVGGEVVDRLPGHARVTTWGSQSIDLAAAIREQLGGIEPGFVGGCTRHDARWLSHRRDATTGRMAAIGWLP